MILYFKKKGKKEVDNWTVLQKMNNMLIHEPIMSLHCVYIFLHHPKELSST